MAVKQALVVYKGKPALAEEKGGRLELTLEGGARLRVRPKDVLFLHPGPASLGLKVPEGEEEAAWELLEGQTVSLRELAELVYGAYTPEAALGAYLLAQKGERFVLEGEGVRARTREELRALEEAERKRAERERAFQEALKRLKEGSPAPEDRPLLAEVEALARGERKESPVLRALNLPETPEAAHAFLLRLGLWQRENPHPRRLGLPLQPPDLPAPPLPEEDRVDLTHLPAFAIDDEGSQDPDDAVFAEKVEGGFRLFVHVADVAALVPPKSPLDEEALRRGANLYLPEGTVPMLPPAVTEALGLGLREVSPALTFELWVSEEGELLEERVYPSWVRVTRLTYREALGVEALRPLEALAEAFRAKRLAAGALEIALPEVKVRVEGEEVRITPLPPYPSRVWVREAMLLAGYAAAHLAVREGLPFPFATQEAPARRVEGEGLAAMWEQRKALKRAPQGGARPPQGLRPSPLRPGDEPPKALPGPGGPPAAQGLAQRGEAPLPGRGPGKGGGGGGGGRPGAGGGAQEQAPLDPPPPRGQGLRGARRPGGKAGGAGGLPPPRARAFRPGGPAQGPSPERRGPPPLPGGGPSGPRGPLRPGLGAASGSGPCRAPCRPKPAWGGLSLPLGPW